MYVLLKQERPEMDEFDKKKQIWITRKNNSIFLIFRKNGYPAKTSQNILCILSFQNILSIFFILEGKLAFLADPFSGRIR